MSDIPGETVAVQWAFGDAASYKHWTQMKARRPSFGADTGDRGTESFIRSVLLCHGQLALQCCYLDSIGNALVSFMFGVGDKS